MHNLLSLPAIH